MSTADVEVIFVKLNGIRNFLAELLADEHSRRGELPQQSFSLQDAQQHLDRAAALVEQLREGQPNMYGDFPKLDVSPDDFGRSPRYSRGLILRVQRELDHLLELRTAAVLAPQSVLAGRNLAKRTVFISHGRAADWREVQSFIEKDLRLATRELEQEASGGLTVGAKLDVVSEQCDSAVIVMTGDDVGTDGTVRARENVMHEVGFFQGKLGSRRVCLLHEEGVNIPSNLAGIVYARFPKGLIHAAFLTLGRELRAIYD